MATIFATTLSFANDNSFIKIKNEANKTSLTLEDVKPGNLISIKDINGITLYKEFIQKTGNYTKGFDLTELPNGEYVFELDKDVEISLIPFTVTADGVSFNKKEEKVIYKPVTRVVGNLLYVTKLALDESPLTIDIYSGVDNSATEPIHTETIGNSKTIERVYKLTGFGQDKFEIVYHSNGRIFTESISL